MKVLSLFDGISCGMVALERAGIPVERYVAYEIDKYAIQISEKNYPQIEHCGDVTTADFTQYEGFDILIGGSPCQGFSSAGKQLNFEDPRSKLFFEFVRALKEVRPKYFLLENVKMKKEYQDIISGYLGAEPTEINSNTFTPMRRNRLYWINWKSAEPKQNKTKLINYLSSDISEKHFLSDAQFEKLTYTEDGITYVKNLPNKKMPIEEGDGVVLSRTWQTYMPVIKGQSHCIRAMNPDDIGVVVSRCEKLTARKFTVGEMERLQTLPANYTNSNIPESQKKKCIGNGWTVDVIAHILRNLTA